MPIQEEVLLKVKHMAGKHPQKTHAGSRGSGGGSSAALDNAMSDFKSDVSSRLKYARGTGVLGSSNRQPNKLSVMGAAAKRAVTDSLSSLHYQVVKRYVDGVDYQSPKYPGITITYNPKNDDLTFHS